MEYLGATSTSPQGGKWRANYWCLFDGILLTRDLVGKRKVNRRDPELLSAYNEFVKYIQRDVNARRWNTIFFQLNDERLLGVMIAAIMGVHEVKRTRLDLYRFNVTTTACNKIAFTYLTEAVAIRDRNRLIMKMKSYHASDDEDEAIVLSPGGDMGSAPDPVKATTTRTGTDGNEVDP